MYNLHIFVNYIPDYNLEVCLRKLIQSTKNLTCEITVISKINLDLSSLQEENKNVKINISTNNLCIYNCKSDYIFITSNTFILSTVIRFDHIIEDLEINKINLLRFNFKKNIHNKCDRTYKSHLFNKKIIHTKNHYSFIKTGCLTDNNILANSIFYKSLYNKSKLTNRISNFFNKDKNIDLGCFLYGTLNSNPVIIYNKNFLKDNLLSFQKNCSLPTKNSKDNSNTIYVSQFGSDGFGHQLHGLITIMAFNGIRNYKFVNYICNRSFAHIKGNKNLNQQMNNYLNHGLKMYQEETNCPIYDSKKHKIQFIKSCLSRSIKLNNISNNKIYIFDNAYRFNGFKMTECEKDKVYANLNKLKKYFNSNNLFLPKNRLPENNIVIHIRRGDRKNHPGNLSIVNNLNRLMKIFYKIYPNYHIFIHTNGEIDTSKFNNKFKIFPRNEPISNSLSDFINSKILVCSYSSLSIVCSLIGNQKEVIVSDLNNQFVPKNALSISKYIEKYK